MNLNEDGSGQIENWSDSQADTQGKMSIDDELENRRIANEGNKDWRR